MYESFNGIRVRLVINVPADAYTPGGVYHECLIVRASAVAEIDDAATLAAVEARYGYPMGTIDVVSVDPPMRCCPMGLPSGPSGNCFYANP